MLPPPQNFQPSSSTSTISGYPPLMQQSFSLGAASQQFNTGGQQGFLATESLHQGTDPNSPELFKHNIHLAQEYVARIQSLARSALTGIQNAYHPGSSPSQTESNIVALKQALHDFDNFMWQTGAGALPVLQPPVAPPAETQLMEDTNRSIQVLYEKLKRSQDSAAVVANLLGAPEVASRK